MADSRLQLAERWLQHELGGDIQLTPLAGDASFRRYFRVTRGGEHWIVMDAPPSRCAVEPFIRVRKWLAAGGVRVPELLACDSRAGLLLLEDFGDTTWAAALVQGADVDDLMADAMAQLLRLQALDGAAAALPPFDRARIARECALYADWYLPYERGKPLRGQERARFLADMEPLLEAITAQPRVAVHLDFHSRNLMVPAGALPLGVIDFQDACVGSICYDIASLIYDCYQDYGEEKAIEWSQAFYRMLPAGHRRCYASWEAWQQALLTVSLQRHIKVCGIFVRLALRDGKRQFLSSLPQTRAHLLHEVEMLAESVDHLRPWLLDSG